MSRSKWKLPFFHSCFFRILKLKSSKLYLTASRSSQIFDKLHQKRFGIYNGKSFKIVRMRTEMIFCKFGEFSTTRRVASGIEMHITKKS